MTGTFAKDSYPPGFYAKFIKLMSEQDVYMSRFMFLASDANTAFYKSTLVGNAVDEVKRMRTIAVAHMNGEFGIDASYWFKTITKKINKLKELEDQMSKNIILKSSEKTTNAMMLQIFIFLASLLILLTIIFITRSITLSISTSIDKFAILIKQVNDGKLSDLKLEGMKNDEMGEVAKMLQSLVATFSMLIERINTSVSLAASGDFSYDLHDDGLKGDFSKAEADYRQAISLNPKDDTAKYNLGTAYYNKEMNDIAMNRFKQAASVADSKADKHKAFHNLGNTYMNEKKYQEAVESYKNALRNNPKDEETRYNLALAKELLEDQEKNGGGGDDNKDQDDKKEENKDKQDNENNKKDGDDGEDKKEQDKGDEEQDKKEGDDEKDKGKPDEPKEDKQEKQPQQPQPGKLSPQQVKNLLEAMNNEEKKVQDKINAKKQKVAKVKSAKDW
jgi:tetratricopeptide (TPR) repeat protein